MLNQPADPRMQFVIDFNPDQPLRSIVRDSPASPTNRVRAIMLLFNGDLGTLSNELRIPYMKLHRRLKSDKPDPDIQRQVADALSLDPSDIWPNGSQPREGASIR